MIEILIYSVLGALKWYFYCKVYHDLRNMNSM